jgi:hypothetical protein
LKEKKEKKTFADLVKVEKRVSLLLDSFGLRQHFYLTRRAVFAAAAFIRATTR